MNHTERIAETARRHRHMTRRMAKEAIETYLELLADEIAEGDWVDIYNIARIRVKVERCKVRLSNRQFSEKPERFYDIEHKLRTQIRLMPTFKQTCYGKWNDPNTN